MAGVKKIEITAKELAAVVPQGATYVTGNLFGDEREEIVFVTETPEGKVLNLAHRLDGAKRGFVIQKLQEDLGTCTQVDRLFIENRVGDKKNELVLECTSGDFKMSLWMNRDQILEQLFPNRPDIQKRYR